MAKIVHALIQHHLTQEEILNLPEVLSKHTTAVLAGEWEWTNHDMDAAFLDELWGKNEKDFINYSASIEDLALLQKDNITIDFMTKRLLTFDTLLQWDTYNAEEQLRTDFNQLVKTIAELVKATDVAIIPDLSSLPFYDANTDLSVHSLREKTGNNQQFLQEL